MCEEDTSAIQFIKESLKRDPLSITQLLSVQFPKQTSSSDKFKFYKMISDVQHVPTVAFRGQPEIQVPIIWKPFLAPDPDQRIVTSFYYTHSPYSDLIVTNAASLILDGICKHLNIQGVTLLVTKPLDYSYAIDSLKLTEYTIDTNDV